MPQNTEEKKIYILDTNVLLHDPASFLSFKENDVGIPMVVLEELDKHKKGLADLARNARQVSRSLGDILSSAQAGVHSFGDGIEILGEGRGRLYFLPCDPQALNNQKNVVGLDPSKADNLILAAVLTEQRRGDNPVVLVTKDINLRVKAHALGITAEDYRTDRVVEDDSLLPSGYTIVDGQYLEANGVDGQRTYFQRKNESWARVRQKLPLNSFLVVQDKSTQIWRVCEHTDSGGSNLFRLPNTTQQEFVIGRSSEQRMALELLYDNDIDFVALLGKAGSGKTLLALAAGMEQVRNKIYDQVILTRATVPLGEDIGFLPGSEAEKMNAWLGGTVQDCYAALGEKATEALKSKVEIASMSFMRGRSFHRKFILIDEAQNLTSKQVRALITRAGNGTKIVVTGNLNQIDTPYLDAGSSGLAWVVKTMQGWQHGGSIILPRSERSRMAAYVEDADESGKATG